MFADISGSTELVEHLDPEAAANLLDPLIGVMTDTVERYDGSVSPRGDGILAMFGVTGATEDNTVRACLAALEILRRLETLGCHRVRIGIHHGQVALLSGRRPSRENFFGPAIHTAARLEQTQRSLRRSGSLLESGHKHQHPHGGHGREAALGKNGDCRHRMRENLTRLQISCSTPADGQTFARDHLCELDLELRE
jgi:class 3 adenylate cyclase